MLDPHWTEHPAYRIATFCDTEETKVRSVFNKKAAVEDPLASLPPLPKAAGLCVLIDSFVFGVYKYKIPLNVKPAEVSAEHMCRAFSLERDRWMDSTRVVNTPRSTIPRETLAKPRGIRIKTDYQTAD